MSRARDNAVRSALVVLQLLGVLLVVRLYELESRTFFEVLAVACAGFTVSSLLPVRRRTPFFLLLSVVALYVAIGPLAAAAVLGAGIVMIGVAHLPIALPLRILALLGIGAGLIALRRVGGPETLATVVVPVIGTIFMFRMALYLHALRHDAVPFDPVVAASYFFMIPTTLFPVFPIVDYGIFARQRFDAPELALYERGIKWIWRGVVHLLFYRIVAGELSLSEAWVNDAGSAAQYIVTTFLLYSRISGQFHIAVGLLHLFGFRLPPTHHRFLLATGFADFWRRINVYWRDFMMKLVFYPVVMRLRRHGETMALVVATLVVFVVTLLLHPYQELWISGSFNLNWQSTAFWMGFSVLVVAAMLRQRRSRRTRLDTQGAWSIRRAASRVATFLTIAVLWSLWSAESVATWTHMLSRFAYGSLQQWAVIGSVAGLMLLAAGFRWEASADTDEAVHEAPFAAASQVAMTRLLLAGLACFVAVAQRPLGSTELARVVRSAQGITILPWQQQKRIDGYYRRLDDAGKESVSQPWRTPSDWLWPQEELEVRRRDFLIYGLRPGLRDTINGKQVSINRYGMRDRYYAIPKPPGTMRIAVIGASDAMGWGVSDAETFEARLEPILDSLARQHGQRVEVLNFSLRSLTLTSEVLGMRMLTERFSPDLVLLTVHSIELIELAEGIDIAMNEGITVPDSALRQLLDSAGITRSLPRSEIAERLRVIEDAWYERLAHVARENAASLGARVATLSLSLVDSRGESALLPAMRSFANVGIPHLDCWDAYAGYDGEELWVSPSDPHPNARGHALIARCILGQFRAVPGLLPAPIQASLDALPPEPNP